MNHPDWGSRCTSRVYITEWTLAPVRCLCLEADRDEPLDVLLTAADAAARDQHRGGVPRRPLGRFREFTEFRVGFATTFAPHGVRPWNIYGTSTLDSVRRPKRQRSWDLGHGTMGQVTTVSARLGG